MPDAYTSPQTIQTIPAGEIGNSVLSPQNISVNFATGIIENLTTITQSYCITTGTGAWSAGPLKIADGVTVKVPDLSTWRIV